MCRRIPCLLLLGGLFLGLSSPVSAELFRGPEFLANGRRAGKQGGPDVAMAPDGHFVVVWVDGGSRGAPANVMARVFSPAGTPRTPDLRVSTSEPGFQDEPRVAVDAAGGFVVVWQSRASANAVPKVYGRLFRADGKPLGERFRLGKGLGRAQSQPEVARTPDGRFIVAWTELDGRISDPFFRFPTNDVFLRRFSPEGKARGRELNVGGPDFQFDPALAVNSAGDFALAYSMEDGESDAEDPGGVAVGLFTQDGLLRQELFPDLETDNYQTRPGVALAEDGGVVLVWRSFERDPKAFEGLHGQRFGADGAPLSEMFHVDTTPSRRIFDPVIAQSADGSFLIAWMQMDGRDGDGRGVFAQQFAADGSKTGPELSLATWTAGNQSAPALSAAPDGRGIAVWQSMRRDGDDFGVAARLLEIGEADPK